MIISSEPWKVVKCRRLQLGMSNSTVMPSPLSCARQHASHQQLKRRLAARPRPRIMKQYLHSRMVRALITCADTLPPTTYTRALLTSDAASYARAALDKLWHVAISPFRETSR